MSFREKIKKDLTVGELFPELSTAQKRTDKLLVAIANRIYDRRKELDKTQAEFASTMRVKQPMVCQWESGNYNFTIETLIEVFDKLGLNVDIVFSERMTKFPSATFTQPENPCNNKSSQNSGLEGAA